MRRFDVMLVEKRYSLNHFLDFVMVLGLFVKNARINGGKLA
jgi:hypothetical protein